MEGFIIKNISNIMLNIEILNIAYKPLKNFFIIILLLYILCNNQKGENSLSR